MVGAGARPRGRRLPGGHVRPPRLRCERQARRRLDLRLRHADRRPRRRADRAGPSRGDPRRLLDGGRRGGPLPRHARLGPRAQRRLRGRDPALPKLDGDHPGGALDDDTVEGHAERGSRPTRPASSTASPATSSAPTARCRSARAQQQEALGLALQGRRARPPGECIRSWTTDFRADLATITVPTLVIHGDSDAIVPMEK